MTNTRRKNSEFEGSRLGLLDINSKADFLFFS